MQLNLLTPMSILPLHCTWYKDLNTTGSEERGTPCLIGCTWLMPVLSYKHYGQNISCKPHTTVTFSLFPSLPVLFDYFKMLNWMVNWWPSTNWLAGKREEMECDILYQWHTFLCSQKSEDYTSLFCINKTKISGNFFMSLYYR